MNKILISITLLIGIVSCITFQKNSQNETTVSYKNKGNDTLINFENETVGRLPIGFVAKTTNKAKSIKWSVINGNGSKVVKQQAENSSSCYNLLVLVKIAYKDFSASVNIKAISGEEDQGGGLVWHYINPNNYYVARYNPLENNFRFYRVIHGKREELKSSESDIKQGEWFSMTIEMIGNKITCSLNGKILIETIDNTFKSSGLIGLWTKADAVTSFDNLKISVLNK